MLDVVIDWVENIIRKGGNAAIMLLGPQCLLFQNHLKRLQLFWVLNMPAPVLKWLIVSVETKLL